MAARVAKWSNLEKFCRNWTNLEKFFSESQCSYERCSNTHIQLYNGISSTASEPQIINSSLDWQLCITLLFKHDNAKIYVDGYTSGYKIAVSRKRCLFLKKFLGTNFYKQIFKIKAFRG